jgi:hypothetical protein
MGERCGWERGEMTRERTNVHESETLDINRMVEKKGDTLRWNNGPGLMKINK